MGRGAAPFLRGMVEYSGAMAGATAAVDWTRRIAAPMILAWGSESELAGAKQKFAQDIGTGLVDYGVGMAAAIPGAAMGWKLTPVWENKAPKFDPRPSLKMDSPAKSVSDETRFVTKAENNVADDVNMLYERSFPLEERQPLAEVQELVKSGRILVHSTRDAEGSLHAFSFVSVHDETAQKFANLDFIATQSAERSQGIGSLHARRLKELVRDSDPRFTAMTLEMESPFKGVEKVAPEEVAVRLRRSKFYDRLDAPDTNVEFNILDFNDPSYRGPAQWRAWVYQPDKFNAVVTARTMHVDEGGYGLSRYAPAVREFELANNYWEPTMIGPKRSALYGSSTGVGMAGTIRSLSEKAPER